jgi:hypothetical protein
MSIFEFISNEVFRASLESDYSELEKCIEVGAWKAAHVLAGSIVEATLLDYLLSTDFVVRSKQDPLKFDLGRVIETCRIEKIISGRVEDLSSVIREYRNLIHPGRTVRTGEAVGSESATIAKSLVILISKEIAAQRKATYGLTSEQILAKVLSDPSNTVVMTHLLKSANSREVSLLLLKTIPKEYQSRDDDQDAQLCLALATCFRTAFEVADDETKRTVAAEFIRVLKNEGEAAIRAYENGMFVSSELKYLPLDTAALVKAHFLDRMRQQVTVRLLRAIEGIEAFISAEEVGSFIDSLVRAVAYSHSSALRKQATKYLEKAYFRSPPQNDAAWRKRLDQWVEHLNGQGKEEQAATVSDLRSKAEDSPF